MTIVAVRLHTIIARVILKAACCVAAVALPTCALAAEVGTLAGVVRYQSDPQRPWRLGRYYMKSLRAGNLAEAVVALRISSGIHAEPDRDPQTRSVDQKDYHFTPETTLLLAGDSVRFTNSDPGVHNVHSFAPIAEFNLVLAPGQEHVQTFPRPGGIRGPVKLDCVFHGEMRAWIFVFRHPHFALTGEDGAFRLEGVPAGEYDLDVAHPAGRLRTSRKVTVNPTRTTAIEFVLTPDNVAND